MTTPNPRRRFTRAFALTGAAAIIASAGLGWHALSASAAVSGQPYETQFEIDGNTAVDGGQDWATDPASAPNLHDFHQSSELCGGTDKDPNRVVPGTKIDDNGILISSPPVAAGNVNTKSDLCSVYQAWELVFVPTADPGDDPQAGQYNFVLYAGWSRPNVNGEIDVLFPLLGSNAQSNDDDLLIGYDFIDSTDTTTITVFDWDGDSWVETAIANGNFEGETTRGVETDPDVGALTFGEFALNLTATGILPEDGPCVNFSLGNPITRTGNSPSATLEDIVTVSPMTLTNCGSLTINKHTQPVTPTSPQSFGAHTEQLDGAIVHAPVQTSIDDTLVVPDSPSVTHADLLISPDYVVTENSLPDGWSEVSLVCTSTDPITGEEVTRTLYDGEEGPDSAFPVAPGVDAVCDITNVGPPVVSVTKTVDGDSDDWSFDFTIDPVPAGDTATKTATAANPTVTWQLEAGVEYTITEGTEDGFLNGDISCGEGGSTFTPEERTLADRAFQELKRDG